MLFIFAAITEASRFRNCTIADQSNPSDVNMFTYDAQRWNNIIPSLCYDIANDVTKNI